MKKNQEELDKTNDDIKAIDYCLISPGTIEEPTHGSLTFRTAVEVYNGGDQGWLLRMKRLLMNHRKALTIKIEGARLILWHV